MQFFSPIRGEALVWFTKTASGVELFDLMGFNPAPAKDSLPVTRNIADDWTKDQLSRQQELDRKLPNP